MTKPITHAKLNTSPVPPAARKIPTQTTQLGFTRSDDYAWLKDENWQAVMADSSQLNPDIRQHLEAENAYTEAVTQDLSALKETIFEEMKGRLKADASSVPSPDGSFAYNHRYRTGDQHGLYERTPIDPSTKDAKGKAQIILDAESLSKDYPAFFDLGSVTHSDDQTWLAYSLDATGAENYEVFVKNIETDKLISTGITKSAGGLQWALDNKTLFWVERDDNQRPYAVFTKNIHDADAKPRLVYKENDPGFFVSVGESDSGSFIEISAHNHTTTEIWLIPLTASIRHAHFRRDDLSKLPRAPRTRERPAPYHHSRYA